MATNGINYIKPLTSYFQEYNGVLKCVEKTIIDMTRATILESNIDDKLWPEIIIAMTYIKNNYSTKASSSNATLYKA